MNTILLTYDEHRGTATRSVCGNLPVKCLITLDTRNNWWIDIINCFNIYLSAELCVLPDNELFIMLLGRQPNMELDTYAFKGFCINNFKLIPYTLAQYNHFMRPHDDLQNRVNYLPCVLA